MILALYHIHKLICMERRVSRLAQIIGIEAGIPAFAASTPMKVRKISKIYCLHHYANVAYSMINLPTPVGA